MTSYQMRSCILTNFEIYMTNLNIQILMWCLDLKRDIDIAICFEKDSVHSSNSEIFQERGSFEEAVIKLLAKK